MKFYLPLLLAFSAVGPALGDEATCNQDSQLVNQHQGQKYTKEIVRHPPPSLFYDALFFSPIGMLTTRSVQASLAKSDTVRVLHPGDAATMDFRPARYACTYTP